MMLAFVLFLQWIVKKNSYLKSFQVVLKSSYMNRVMLLKRDNLNQHLKQTSFSLKEAFMLIYKQNKNSENLLNLP